MKKEKDHLLIVLCSLFTVFLIGIFIGRYTSNYPVALKRNDSSYSLTAESTNTALYIDGKMNVNIATAKDLQLIPSIGETLANSIVAHREQYGPFASVSDLSKVDGLGATRILQIIDYIIIGGSHENTGR